MEKFLTILGASVLIVLGLTLVAIMAGTILWLIYPIAIPVAFPALVAKGYLAKELSWWSSVCLTWVANILIKSSNTNNISKN